jgi:arylsulfatase A-like enzyme
MKNIPALPVLFYTGSWMALCAYTQFKWAFTYDYYDDFGLRLAGAGITGVVLAVLIFIFWHALTGCCKETKQDGSLVRTLACHHAVFYLLLLYPFHIGRLNNYLAGLALLGYLVPLVLRLIVVYISGPHPAGTGVSFTPGWRMYWQYLQQDLARVREWAARRAQGGYFGIYFFTWLMLGIHLICVFWIFNYPVYNAADLVVSVACSLLCLTLLVHLAKLLSGGRRWAAGATTVLLAFLYIVLYGYHYGAQTPFDLELFISNFSLLSSSESWQLIGDFFTKWNVAALVTVLALMALLEKKFQVFSQAPAKVRLPHIAVTLALLGGLAALPVATTDETMLLASAVVRHFAAPDGAAAQVHDKQYPYVQDSLFISQRGRSAQQPHVFIIFLESFGGQQVRRRLAAGREVTPVFNALVPQGVYVEQFYGNSIQTCKGQFATLAGTWPALRYKIFTTYPDLHMMPLPRILRNNGYYTMFIKAYHDLSFDNTGYFTRRMGYHEVLGMDEQFVSASEKAAIWGWGIEDSLYYRKVFGYLDTCRGRGIDQPLFVTLTSITNHFMFNRTPPAKKLLFPDSAPEHNYLNTVHLADKFLAEFFAQLRARDYLKNSLVVLVGDHGFPSGEHGYYHNEVSFYEEFFRTPLLILWPGKLAPRAITGRAYSQVDIAPTLLDLLEIQSPNHFTGCSLFDPARQDNAALLIQPYSGMYLAAVKYPWKYVQGIATGAEYLFNLADDPGEKSNLIKSKGHAAILLELNHGIDRLKAHDVLVRSDRIWPAGN